LVDGAIGATLARVPLVTTDHTKAYPTSRRWRLLENGASRIAKVMVAVSEQSKADLIRYQRIARRKLAVIYNGLDLKLSRRETALELRREIGVAADDLVIGTAARLEDQKGLDLLLDAVPLIAQSVPKARVVIVGGGNNERALREQTERMGLGDRVTITGYRVDGVDLINTFDCFVQTSHWEGMPMALLEAMALRKPIVATAVGGVPEVVVDGETGILLPTRDRDALARSLIRVLTDRDEAARLGDAGHQRYRAHFTSAGMIAAYEQLYASVFAGGRQPVSEWRLDRAAAMPDRAAVATMSERR
jgi:glycosyltransferase involved in cell wall biosynthesis